VYVTPHHQYPTTVLLAPARRLALLARARAEAFAVIEDDYDHEFHFDGRPVAPLASADPGGTVIYAGTLSKIVAPGLRLGFVIAPAPVIDALAARRAPIDRHGDLVLEHAVAAMIEDGELQRHVRKARAAYANRREVLARALARELGGALSFTLPAGGLTLWARADDGVRLDRWQARARARGVAIAIGRDFALDGRARPFVRLGFAFHDEAELVEAVKLLRRALRDR
jgi:GntR family transcriptional regulator/MocR family aminotransferase